MLVWDASVGKVYGDVTPNLSFVKDYIIGSPASPQLIETNDAIIKDIPLASGWTWTSFNLNSNQLADVNILLDDLTPTDNDIIKNQVDFSVYNAGSGNWSDKLYKSDPLNNQTMYMVNVTNPDTIRYIGTPVDPADVTLNIVSGWNWLGYTPDYNLSVNDALGQLSSSEGDILKGQKAFAMYDNNMGWIGSLRFMEPDKGYMMNSVNSESFEYPTVAPNLKSAILNYKNIETIDNIDWKVNVHDYQYNMSVIAKVAEPIVLSSNAYVLAAFEDHNIRGVTEPTYIEETQEWYYFITVYSNDFESVLNFKLGTNDLSEEYIAQEKIAFVPDGINGSISAPILLTFVENEDIRNDFRVYPNPFSDAIAIELNSPSSEDIVVNIYDITGMKVDVLKIKAGENKLIWNSENNNNTSVSDGIYIIQLNIDNTTMYKKVMKSNTP